MYTRQKPVRKGEADHSRMQETKAALSSMVLRHAAEMAGMSRTNCFESSRRMTRCRGVNCTARWQLRGRCTRVLRSTRLWKTAVSTFSFKSKHDSTRSLYLSKEFGSTIDEVCSRASLLIQQDNWSVSCLWGTACSDSVTCYSLIPYCKITR